MKSVSESGILNHYYKPFQIHGMTKIELADKAEHLIIKALDNIWQHLYQQQKTTTNDISPIQSLRLETLQRELAELIAEVIW